MRRVLVAGMSCVVLLAGCMEPKTAAERWQPQCESYGYKPKTPEMVNCIAEETRAHKARAMEIVWDDD